MNSEIDLLNQLLESGFTYIVLERRADNPYTVGLTAFRDLPFSSPLYLGKHEDRYGLGAEVSIFLDRELIQGEPVAIIDLIASQGQGDTEEELEIVESEFIG